MNSEVTYQVVVKREKNYHIIGGADFSGKGVHMYKGVGLWGFALPISFSFSLNIT